MKGIPDGGPEGLLAAVFRRALMDLGRGGELAEEADAFLRDPMTVANLAEIGVDPHYYCQMLDAPERGQEDIEVEYAERIHAMADCGMYNTDIELELAGTRSAQMRLFVNRTLGPARRGRRRRERQRER